MQGLVQKLAGLNMDFGNVGLNIGYFESSLTG